MLGFMYELILLLLFLNYLIPFEVLLLNFMEVFFPV